MWHDKDRTRQIDSNPTREKSGGRPLDGHTPEHTGRLSAHWPARSRNTNLLKNWRRGWAFEVAVARATAPTEGARSGRLTISPACANVTLLIRRVAHPLVSPHERGKPLSQSPFESHPRVWRRGWDSNPRSPYGDSGFRDRPIRPLSHLSASTGRESALGREG